MFAEDLLKTLKNWGVTQSELAKELGRSRGTVCQWCNGHYLPSEDDMKKIAHLFDMDLAKYKQEMDNRPNLPKSIFTSSGKVMNNFNGERLKKMRNEKGLLRSELAKKIGVSADTIKNWELSTTRPLVSKIQLLSDYFKVSVEYWEKEKEYGAFTPTEYVRPEIKEKVNLSENPYKKAKEAALRKTEKVVAEKRLIFKENSKYKGKNAVGCSADTYKMIQKIADRSGEQMSKVTDRLIEYAVEHIEWIVG